MAFQRIRLGAWENEAIQAHITFNDASANITKAELVNASLRRMRFELWRTADPNLKLVIDSPPGQPPTEYDVPNDIKFSLSDPLAKNWDYRAYFVS